MKQELIAIVIAMASLPAFGFEQSTFPLAADSITVSTAAGRTALVVTGRAQMGDDLEDVTGKVQSLAVEGLLSDGRTTCEARTCHARLRATSSGVMIIVEKDADQDGNIDVSVPMRLGRADGDGVLQVEPGLTIKALYVQDRVRWFERTDGQRNRDYVSLTIRVR